MHNGYETWQGMAFAMSNTAENRVSAFARERRGTLQFIQEQATGGSGTGDEMIDPLVSQGALITNENCRFLFAVNAGNNTVSSFRLQYGDMALSSVIPSGGARPVSLASSGNLLYILNAGGTNVPANLSGFFVDQYGMLSAIPDSTTPLSMPNAQPSCVVFSPDGRYLVVSERSTNALVTYSVQAGGQLANPTTFHSNGETPFGMVFTNNGFLLVVEVGPNALSSYRISENGTLTLISGSVPNQQRATCWVSATPDGQYAYTSNTGTGTISLYRVGTNGDLTLMETVPSTPLMDGAPIDSAIGPCGAFFYVLNGAQGSISVFQIGTNGHPALIQIYENTGLPQLGAQGLAVC